MSKRSPAVAVALWVSWGAVAAAADASLPLVWSDPQKLVSRGYETMADEVAEILRDAGHEVQWSRLDEDTFRTVGKKILVVLVPRSGQAWGLPEDTLGAVMGRGGPIACVYVFYPTLARSLGLRRPRSPRDVHVLARAIGRVASHEIVHALAPAEPHTADGLMQARLSRRALVAKELALSKVSPAARDRR